jgi:hypothetical protein
MRPEIAQVPPFAVRFASPLRFGEHLPGLIATRELHVAQTWQPEPSKGRVGDGFTRTVTLTAPDVPGMVFPPLLPAKVDGLGVYPKPPVVQDHVERSDFTGKRIEEVTYICERSGQFTLPALIIPWCDLKNQTLMQVTLPAVTLEVEPAPASSLDAAASSAEGSGWQWLWWIVGAVLLLATAGAAGWRKRDVLLAAWQRRQAPGQRGWSLRSASRRLSRRRCQSRLHRAAPLVGFHPSRPRLGDHQGLSGPPPGCRPTAAGRRAPRMLPGQSDELERRGVSAGVATGTPTPHAAQKKG